MDNFDTQVQCEEYYSWIDALAAIVPVGGDLMDEVPMLSIDSLREAEFEREEQNERMVW